MCLGRPLTSAARRDVTTDSRLRVTNAGFFGQETVALNDRIFVRFGGVVARALWWVDVRIVDGTVNGIASLTQTTGRGIRQIQTGHVQNYALGIAAGLLVIAVTYIFVVAR